MKPPFTIDQFLEVFKNYNQAVFPMQFVLYMLSVIALYLALNPIPQSSRIVSAILSFFWLWMGMVYNLIYFSPINKAANFFGGMFILEGLFFLYYGVFQNKLNFQFHGVRFGVTGISLVVFALIGYPLFNLLVGHSYPYAPSFGLPCPTTIFTFGLLLLSSKKIPAGIFIIPFMWSIIGFTAAIRLGMTEDISLLVSAGLTVAILILRNIPLHKKGFPLTGYSVH